MMIISRLDAKKQGLIRYFTGKPCVKGHVSERRVSNWMCVDCGLEHDKNFYASKPDKKIATAIKWNQENKDKHQEHRKKWKKLNVDLVNINTAKRRYARLKRTPFWLNAGQDFEMECIYKYCASLRSIGLDYEVDHIVPLQGKTVSGLHVPWNLQVITASENAAKGNRLW